MKIIGQYPGSLHPGFIVQITESEMYNLLGYYYAGSEGAPRLKVGDEVQVSAMYQQLRKLSDLSRQIGSAQQTLRSAATVLDLIKPITSEFEGITTE